ncbi:hypothetical protein RBA41_32590 [Massilia sp. CCM 9210]|uniref:hypothetical protein n=1 Tax=Massilia scottii TaxID=3057166 RepID=UPI0027963E31|nr:hypothetical protein [Massilia sp. CCM 9210]MDQ1818049.1 hypothetical protein [Massilia sp. CCM 9210]
MSEAGIPASPTQYRDRDIEAGPLILGMRRIDGPDRSSMQIVSADLLAHYRRCEAELSALKAAACQTAEDKCDSSADFGAE